MRSPQKIEHVSLYYRNLPVTPLRCTQGQAFVQSGTASLSLKTLPHLPSYCPTNPSTELFPGCNTSIGPRIALDTVSGNLVNPQSYRGHAPAVCVLGEQYGPSCMQCARGLFTKRQTLINHCKVYFSDLGVDPLVTSLDFNQYAITTVGLTLTIHCLGALETHMSLGRGTVNVTCLKPCTLASADFSITCVGYVHLTRKFVMPTATITSYLNFGTAVAVNNLISILPKTKPIHMSPLADLDLPVIHHPRFSTAMAHPLSRKYHSVWNIIAYILSCSKNNAYCKIQ